MVRDTLGEDAIIVATREQKGGTVHVTAAMEPGFHGGRFEDDQTNFEVGTGAASPAGADDWLQYDDEDEEAAVAEDITEAMLKHSVPEDVLDHVISCATVIGLQNPGEALTAAVEHLFSFTPLPRKASTKSIMLVGQPGAGKTLSVAKLAARGAMNGLKTAVITCDTVRAGGVEQLQAFTNLLQTPLEKAATPEELAQALQKLKGMDQIFIDTQGVNPFNTADKQLLAKMIGAGNIEPILVMPMGGDSEESGEIAQAFAALGVNRIMPSRMDIARRIGGLLSAAYQGKMAFTDAANTPKVADGLMQISPETLSRMIMPEAYKTGGKSNAPQKKKTA